MNKTTFKNKKWFLVSYDSLRTSLVGGNRINRLHSFLSDEGYDCTLISREISPKEGIRIDDSRLVRVGKKYMGGSFPIDSSIIWAFKAYRYLRSSLKNVVVLTSQPPFGLSYLGLIAKFFNKDFYWIADFRDSWTLNPLYNPFPFGKLFAGFYEKKVFQKADLIIFNTDTDRKNYCVLYPNLEEKSIVVRNGFEELVDNGYQPPSNDKIRIIYSGGAYPKAVAAKNVVKFIEGINNGGCDAICDYFGEYDSILSKSDFINYRGKVSQKEVPKMLSTYRFGLIYLQEECLGGGRVTQKFYDYIGSGVLPIVINPSKEMLNMMSDLQTGIILFSKTEVDATIPILQAESKAESYQLEKELLNEYSNEYQFEKLLEYFEGSSIAQ